MGRRRSYLYYIITDERIVGVFQEDETFVVGDVLYAVKRRYIEDKVHLCTRGQLQDFVESGAWVLTGDMPRIPKNA